MRLSFTLVGALAAGVLALPASVPHVVHEKRSGVSSWSHVTNSKPNGHTTLPVRIGLKQSNLDRGHDILMDISSPTSENYGKHLSADEVRGGTCKLSAQQIADPYRLLKCLRPLNPLLMPFTPGLWHLVWSQPAWFFRPDDIG